MNIGRISTQKGNFNIEQLYQDLRRVEGSLERTKHSGSRTKQPIPTYAKENKFDHLTSFKKEINNKHVAKTKISLGQPHEKFKISRTSYQQDNRASYQQDSRSIYEQKSQEECQRSLDESQNMRVSEMSGEEPDNAMDRLRTNLLSWKKEQFQQEKVVKDVDCKKYDALKKQKFTQNDQQERRNYIDTIKPSENESINGSSTQLSSTLFQQLTRRNRLYHCAQRELGIANSSSKWSRSDELSSRLEDHFHEHQTMQTIICQFRRICGLDITNLKELYAVLVSGENEDNVDQ